MVAQYYDTDVNKEYAICGNSAILKCVVPSFVADFVKVLSWQTDQGDEFVPGDDYGTSVRRVRTNRSENDYLSPFPRADRRVPRRETGNSVERRATNGEERSRAQRNTMSPSRVETIATAYGIRRK